MLHSLSFYARSTPASPRNNTQCTSVADRCPAAAPLIAPQVRAVIPRRSNLSAERGVLITAATSFKQKNNIYIFLQVGGGCNRSMPFASCSGDALAPLRLRCCGARCGHIGAGRRGHHAMLRTCTCAALLCCTPCCTLPGSRPSTASHAAASLQSEYGDLYRVSLDYEGEQVKGELAWT